MAELWDKVRGYFCCSDPDAPIGCARAGALMKGSSMSGGPRLFLTGFGPFANVTDNPSIIVARALNKNSYEGLPIEMCESLEVSKCGVDDFCNNCCATEEDIILHFGVAQGSKEIRLERRGANDMNFGIPDFRGHYAEGKILPNGENHLYSSLPIDALHNAVLEGGAQCVISDDAGTYLCNYVYYLSLNKYHSRRVLFVHIPSFEDMPERNQVDAISCLIERLAEMVRSNDL